MTGAAFRRPNVVDDFNREALQKQVALVADVDHALVVAQQVALQRHQAGAVSRPSSKGSVLELLRLQCWKVRLDTLERVAAGLEVEAWRLLREATD